MKNVTLKFVLLLFLSGIVTANAAGISLQVTLEEALELVKTQYSDEGVDIFLCKNMSDYNPDSPTFNPNSKWTFFVDLHPYAGWGHEAYLVRINKKGPLMLSDPNKCMTKTLLSSPPDNDEFIRMSGKKQYEQSINSKPRVPRNPILSNNPSSEGNRYAIILSGGINKEANHVRYWNDCSFIYQTLINRYGFAKDNVYPIMSDGDNPAKDMRITDNLYTSSPLDLDFDGVNELSLAASKSNVQNVINAINATSKTGDHLFIYVIDHGGSDDKISRSFICLWNEERLYDYELAQMLSPIANKGVVINSVLGQCFSGGFIDDLEGIGCIVATACNGSESSWACFDKPYDEFVYHWTSAVNGMDASEKLVISDFNNDGIISMDEAFKYAQNNDIWCHENFYRY